MRRRRGRGGRRERRTASKATSSPRWNKAPSTETESPVRYGTSLLLLFLHYASPFVPPLHLLEPVMGPRSLDRWHVNNWLVVWLATFLWVERLPREEPAATPAHAERTATAAASLPATSPPSAQATQILVQQTVVVTPKLSYLGHKGRISFEALLISLTGSLPTLADGVLGG